jgi:hypothetical protein
MPTHGRVRRMASEERFVIVMTVGLAAGVERVESHISGKTRMEKDHREGGREGHLRGKIFALLRWIQGGIQSKEMERNGCGDRGFN